MSRGICSWDIKPAVWLQEIGLRGLGQGSRQIMRLMTFLFCVSPPIEGTSTTHFQGSYPMASWQIQVPPDCSQALHPTPTKLPWFSPNLHLIAMQGNAFGSLKDTSFQQIRCYYLYGPVMCLGTLGHALPFGSIFLPVIVSRLFFRSRQ